MKNLIIKGYGYALGEHNVSNHDLEKVVDTNDEWIFSRTGISNRTVSTSENTSDLATRAAIQAIKQANIKKELIDLIIVATMTPDNITPATAPLVQQKLGLNDASVMAFDINAACTGFVYGMQIAASMLNSQQYKHALIIGAETFSKIIDWKDRNTCVLFGDGAGAIVLSYQETEHEMFFFNQSKGDVEKQLYAQGLPLNDYLENKRPEVGFLQMNGQEVFRFATFAMKDAIRKVCAMANVQLKDIDLIVPHQANQRIIQHANRHLDIDVEKFYMNLSLVGNTSAASIPIALAQAHEKGILQGKEKIVLVGFGAGLTWGAAYISLEGGL
jgi:3-oxoacyl-[acyl-carrier-protein] synthase-3